MLIVGGTFEFQPEDREAFLASRHESMRKSRAEPGCIEYTLSADPIDTGRVVLYERWESQAALDAHLAGLQESGGPTSPAPLNFSVMVYDIASERPLR